MLMSLTNFYMPLVQFAIVFLIPSDVYKNEYEKITFKVWQVVKLFQTHFKLTVVCYMYLLQFLSIWESCWLF